MPKASPPKPRDFEREAATLRQELEGVRWKAVYGLLDLETDWALALAGAKPSSNVLLALKKVAPTLDAARARDAEAHLARAQQWQQEIASWATSGAEGMVGMYQVRVLQLARALLLLAAAGRAERSQARTLCAAVERDANGVPSELRAQLRALKKALG